MTSKSTGQQQFAGSHYLYRFVLSGCSWDCELKLVSVANLRTMLLLVFFFCWIYFNFENSAKE